MSTEVRGDWIKDPRITQLAREVTGASDPAVPRILIRLQEVLDGFESGSRELSGAKAQLWKYELHQVMLTALKQDFSRVVEGWSVAAKLSTITVSCSIGLSPPNAEFFLDTFLVDLVHTLLMLAGKLQKKYVKTSLVLEDTKAQMLLNFRSVVESTSSLITSFDNLAKIAVQSASYLQMLLTDDAMVSQRAMTLLQSICRVYRGFFETVDRKIGYQILDELIFKLTVTQNAEVASYASRTLLSICESHPPTIQLIASRYKGLRVLLRKWSDKGTIGEFQLLLDVGNLQTARLAKDARAAMLIQAWWKSYQTRKKLKRADGAMARLQRSYRSRKAIEDRRRQEDKMEAELQHMLLMQRKYNMRQLHRRQLHALDILPPSAVSKHLAEEQTCAAVRIQAAWKGYVTKRGLDERRREVKRLKAAIFIQRIVRTWLERVHEKKAESTVGWLRPVGLTDERRVELHEKIIEWRENRKVKLGSRAEQERLHRRAQELIGARVVGARTVRQRAQHVEALLGQLDMDANLLLNMPPLAQVSDAELRSGMFACRSVPLALDAKQRHVDSLRHLAQPWWRSLGNDDFAGDEGTEEGREDPDSWKLF